MLDILKEYKRPFDKINELVKKGELTPIKNGLYIPGPKLHISQPEAFLVANHLWGPSYISQDSALSWWSLIPERVYGVTSTTIKSSRIYKTQLRKYSFIHAAFPYYSFGIRSVTLTPRQVVLIASPEKALCDKVVMTAGIVLRSIKQTAAFLMDDLRIEKEALQQLDVNEINSWLPDTPKRSSLQMLVKTLQGL